MVQPITRSFCVQEAIERSSRAACKPHLEVGPQSQIVQRLCWKCCANIMDQINAGIIRIQYYIDSKKSPTGPTEWTPKPEYPIALATSLGVRW